MLFTEAFGFLARNYFFLKYESIVGDKHDIIIAIENRNKSVFGFRIACVS